MEKLVDLLNEDLVVTIVTTRWGGYGEVAPLGEIVAEIDEISRQFPHDFYRADEVSIREDPDGNIWGKFGEGEEWEKLFSPA
jgi:hypothetical protein